MQKTGHSTQPPVAALADPCCGRTVASFRRNLQLFCLSTAVPGADIRCVQRTLIKRTFFFIKASGFALILAARATAQGTPPSPSPDTTISPPKAAPATTPSLDFSGILFANYQYRQESSARSANRFDVERAYLTFRVPAGKRASVRITTDLFQQTSPGADAYYRGWSVRAKYAYLQYNYLAKQAWGASARIGLLQTVFIEHDETFWPRWIGNSPTERAGYFSSADAGIANTLTLPGRRGEIYSTITNGPGYTSRETDRFKDFATRFTVTPWLGNASHPLRSTALSAWAYKGAVASRFVNGGSGQVGSVGDALDRSRWGVHVATSLRQVILAAQYAQRMDEGESGLNTTTSPRQVTDSTGVLMSVYTIVRPFTARESAKPHPFSILARFDRVITNTDSDDAYDVIIAGVIWDFTSRFSLSLDHQQATPRRGDPIPETRTLFAHIVARF